jgi:ATP-dependent 26S proteasome regulatory subunit
MITHYQNTYHHIQDELILVDLLLHRETMKIQQIDKNESENDKLNGLFITRKKLEKLNTGQSMEIDWFGHYHLIYSSDPDMKAIIKAIEVQKTKIDNSTRESLRRSVALKLLEVKQKFCLLDEEYLILNICLAVQILPQYEKVFAYLHDNAARRLPSIDLILNILNSTFEEKISSRDYFSFQSPLIENRIIEFTGEPYENSYPSSLRQLKINNRIYRYILDRKGAEKELATILQQFAPDQYSKKPGATDKVGKDVHDFIEINKDAFLANDQAYMFYFCGPYGSGKKDVALSIGHSLNLPLLMVDIEAACNTESDKENIFLLINRESILLNSAIYLYNTDVIFEHKENVKLKNYLIRALSRNSRLIIVSSRDKYDVRSEFKQKRFFYIDFPIPSYKKRQDLWNLYLKDKSILGGYRIAKETDVNFLAGKFRFTGGQINDAIKAACTSARWKSNGNKTINEEEIYHGCHLQSNQDLKSLAREVTTKYTLDDIILPKDQKNQLAEIINCVKNKYIVYDEMGFADKMPYGKGLNILFNGPSGTGKTMASAIIANTLNLEIYEINISQILSKFVGETEKRIASIFRSARNAVLFFDEADALFGRRTMIKDAHDKYANIETSFLLREIEKYEEGCVLLATNRKDNMDEAFSRRMDFDVEFPFPSKEHRLKIWDNIFPEQTPLDENIDFDFLAEKFNLSGGNIHNIALASAFYAAQDEKLVKMEHLIMAVKREYQKNNKLCNKNDFGQYYNLIN